MAVCVGTGRGFAANSVSRRDGSGAGVLTRATPSPQPLYRATILRPVIIAGRHYEPGAVVYVTADVLRELVYEFAVDPHERSRRR